MKLKSSLALGAGALISLTFAGSAKADLVCDAFILTAPVEYGSFLWALDTLAAAGVVSDAAECERMAAAGGNDVAQALTAFLPQTLANCICKAGSYQPPPQQVGQLEDPPYSQSEPMDNLIIGLVEGFTCSAGYRVTGMSRHPGGAGNELLCSQRNTTVFSGAVSADLVAFGRSDQRRATRVLNGSFDWAPGFYKMECGENEYVSGIGEAMSWAGLPGVNPVWYVSCAVSPQGLKDVCQTRTFDAHDDRAQGGPDWDVGSYKGECAWDQYVAGVSLDTSTLAPHSLLCCNVQ